MWHRDSPTSIELLSPAEGSLPGDRVFIEGLSGTDTSTSLPDTLNPKKKIWDRLQVSDVTHKMFFLYLLPLPQVSDVTHKTFLCLLPALPGGIILYKLVGWVVGYCVTCCVCLLHYRVFQRESHKFCHVINFKPFILGLQCLHQNVQQRLLLTIDKNICFLDKCSLLIGRK